MAKRKPRADFPARAPGHGTLCEPFVCPVCKRVWQWAYQTRSGLREIEFLDDFPTLGLDRLSCENHEWPSRKQEEER